MATEEVGGELLLCDASGTAVHRISGDARRYFERVARGDGELPDDQVTAALVAANVLLPVGTDSAISRAEGMSRRHVMALGAAAAAAVGVVTVGLPSAAAAQSPGPNPDAPVYPDAPIGPGTEPGDNSIQFVTIQDTQSSSRFTNVDWYTSAGAPILFNWALYSPGNIGVSGNLINAGGPVSGSLPGLGQLVTGVVPPQSILWLLTAVGGEQTFVPSTFPGP